VRTHTLQAAHDGTANAVATLVMTSLTKVSLTAAAALMNEIATARSCKDVLKRLILSEVQ